MIIAEGFSLEESPLKNEPGVVDVERPLSESSGALVWRK